MNNDVRQLFEKALALSPADRASLANSLLESLPNETDELHDEIDPDIEKQWLSVAQRRAAELDSGAVQGVPWPEVYERLQARIKR